MGAGARAGVALLLAAAALAGCGGSDEHGGGGTTTRPIASQGVGIVRAESTAQFADCSDWRGGTVRQRRITIQSIRGQLTPQRSTTAASPLPDDAAYRIFDKTCSSGIADSLRLYKLYARAQAFARLTTAGDDTYDWRAAPPVYGGCRSGRGDAACGPYAPARAVADPGAQNP